MNRHCYRDVLACGFTVITAHSGCESTPANSIEHILAAIDSGAEMIEVDVRKHGELLYLWHDVAEDPFSCVSLRECFEKVRSAHNLCMNIDVKTDDLIQPVMKLAEEYDMKGRIIFTGACNSQRALALECGADMWRSCWKGDSVEAAIECNKIDGSPFLNVWYPMITPEFEDKLRQIGGSFSAWTVDNEDDIKRLLKLGIANITTRRPKLALKLRSEIQCVQIKEDEIISTVRKAGELLKSARASGVSVKSGAADFCTQTDIAIEKLLKTELSKLVPVAGFIGEETGGCESEYTFIVDPIDGTTNYIHDAHMSCISVALVKGGMTLIGVVYNPWTDEVFSAVKGHGAYLNGENIHTSDRIAQEAVIGVGTSPYNRDKYKNPTIKMIDLLLEHFGDIRRCGSATLEMCNVACGRTEAFCEMCLAPWDFAAGRLIVEEAGGITARFDGSTLPSVCKSDAVFASSAIAKDILNVLSGVQL